MNYRLTKQALLLVISASCYENALSSDVSNMGGLVAYNSVSVFEKKKTSVDVLKIQTKHVFDGFVELGLGYGAGTVTELFDDNSENVVDDVDYRVREISLKAIDSADVYWTMVTGVAYDDRTYKVSGNKTTFRMYGLELDGYYNKGGKWTIGFGLGLNRLRLDNLIPNKTLGRFAVSGAYDLGVNTKIVAGYEKLGASFDDIISISLEYSY